MTSTASAGLWALRHRRHMPNAPEADFLYRVYKLLLQAPRSMGNHAKKRTLENAADGVHSWKVVCITEAALEHLVQAKTTKTLRRAHEASREWRFQQIFGQGARVWGKDELMEHFFEHDICAMVTSAENLKHGSTRWSALHEVPDHILCKGSFAVYARVEDVKWATAKLVEIRQQAE